MRGGGFRRAVAGAALAVAPLVAPPASAQKDEVANPDGALPNFDLATIEPLLKELGGTVERKTGDNGEVRLVANYQGLLINFYPDDCNAVAKNNCKSLEMIASTDRTAFKGDDTALLRFLNDFNNAHSPSRAIWLDAGDTGVTRYLIGDHGITRGNFAVEVGVFGQLWDRFFEDLKAGKVNAK